MLYESLARDGLLLADDLRPFVDDPRSLTRDVDRGVLVKLRRGAYVPSAAWLNLDSRGRHLLRARAVVAASDRPLILAGRSAAAVWGMPIAGRWPDEVSVLDEWRGGGRSEPGVRRTAMGFPSAQVQEVDGFRVTSLARTALDVARRHPFLDAVGSIDWALWRKNPAAISLEELADELQRMNPRTGRRHLERIVEFGTSLSDSFGESRARAQIHLCGFVPPELQVEFRDAEGLMITDFFWRKIRKACEFDGKVKYTRDDLTGGDPGEVVWQEKKRQDRLGRLGVGVERIVSHDVDHPALLSQLLTTAGVPRRG